MTIFLENKRLPYRDSIERFFYMLQVVEREPLTKFRIMCALSTNYDVIDRYLKLAYRYNLLILNGGLVTITDKGRRILESWKVE